MHNIKQYYKNKTMKKLTLLFLLTLHVFFGFSINYIPVENEEKGKDTIRTLNLDEFVITSSVKETNVLKRMPTAISIISPKILQSRQVNSLTSMSGIVPNFFIPNYGSKVSTPIYIRGIGARIGAQTVSLYVDNVPYFNASAFDFEFQDIQRIEVLRGTQGTLYGRNAIGGIVNVYTLSPLTYQGSTLEVGGGNYGQMEARMSNYSKFSDKFGSSLALYYKKNDGYFINNYTGKKADDYENIGGRLKFELKANEAFSANLFSVFDYVSQGAFPYMHIDSTAVNFNEPSSYKRKLFSQGLSLKYQGDGFVLNSNTGYQYLNDEMYMDQDYSPRSVFSILQEQNQHSISQEITFKSDKKDRYNWVVGAFGFYDYRKVSTPVALKEDGVKMLQNRIDKGLSNMPADKRPSVKYVNDRIDLPGTYRKPAKGIALFQQSSINSLFGAKGLSLTFGIRADYEHTAIEYFTETQGVEVKVDIPPMYPGMPPISRTMKSDTLMEGRFSKGFWEVLPKIALQYDLRKDAFVYASISKGYKTGGYNEQSFSDILQNAMQQALMGKMPMTIPGGGGKPGGTEGNPTGPPASQSNEMLDSEKPKKLTLEEQLSYDPETSWNYEFGGRFTFLDKKMNANFSLFAMDVDNIQIIHLLNNATAGRTVSNAGKSSSKGVELSLVYAPTNSISLFSEYGFVSAKFKNYKSSDTDYTDNYIPFAPRHTLSVGGSYSHSFNNGSFINRVTASAQYTGAGKFYWTDANDAYQSFYGLTNASVTVEKGNVALELWAKNLFDTSYNAFYFVAKDIAGTSNPLVQKGTPTTFGAKLRYTINY